MDQIGAARQESQIDINSPIGQQIFKSIERGHMVPTSTGFGCQDLGWCYDHTNIDYFVRRKPQTLQIERIYLGLDMTIPVNALEPDEYLRVGTSATYDELLYPRTLPFNVKRNVRPGGYEGRQLIEKCAEKQWVVTEHDPAKWPYFEKPFPRGSNGSYVQSPSDMWRSGWPVNATYDACVGIMYGGGSTHAADPQDISPPPYDGRQSSEANRRVDEATLPETTQTPMPEPPTQDQRRAWRHASWAAEEAQWAEEHPAADNAIAALGATLFIGAPCRRSLRFRSTKDLSSHTSQSSLTQQENNNGYSQPAGQTPAKRFRRR